MQRNAIRAPIGGVDTDIPFAALVTGNNLRFNGSQVDSVARIVLAMTADFVVPSSSQTVITGLSTTLLAGTYAFQFTLYVAQTVATSLNGFSTILGVAPTRIVTGAVVPASLSAASFDVTNGNGNLLGAAVSQGIGVNVPVLLSGIVVVPSTTTFSVRGARSAATTTILAGSGGTIIQQ